MSDSEELNNARRKLQESLGDKSTRYYQLMKLWFRMQYSKERFDLEVRKLLTNEQVHLHNSFLLCLLNKCCNLASTSPKSQIPTKSEEKCKKTKFKRRNRWDKGFEPAVFAEYVPKLNPLPSHAQEEPQRYCVQEHFLPDSSLIYARLMLSVWEHGLEGAEEAVAEYLVVAVKQMLKNVLMTVLSRKNGYKVREGCFIYGIGTAVPNPWLRTTVKAMNISVHRSLGDEEGSESEEYEEHIKKPTLEDVEQKAATEIACGNNVLVRPTITAYDVLEALQVYQNVIPSNKLYSMFVQRVINTLYHPSHEEIEAGALQFI